MRRLLLALLLAFAALATPGQALPTPGFASDNVEWLGNVPLHADTAGAHLLGGYLYVTSSHELTVYDIRTPETPVLLSTLPIPQMPYFAEEDVDTNGKVLLIGTLGSLLVIDVRDKSRPTLVGTLQGGDEHTVTCVLDCTWAYGSYGEIVDLRDPAAPKLAGDWATARKGGPGTQHDVTEVSPGIVVTSSETMWVLDARQDPAHPKVLATGAAGDGRFVHANLWPRQGKDRLLLVGGETETVGTGDACADKDAGAFMTWDTSGWQTSNKLRLLDSYRPATRTPTTGGALAYETYCSHWFTPRPGWQDGGQVAVGWYEHGTRLLQVAKSGKIKEIGYFVPAATTASAAYWVSKDLLYVLDYQRGLDILRVHDGKAPRAIAPGATGLRPNQQPAHLRTWLPGSLDGDKWRCR
ncbi:MAG: hypothetical protein LC789_07800 [Actinobacteria bacterium]|nr:hypothetical protein [Actinomycetota bacterium]MCA1719662.1 hypothetical protein [Actinomycetota bacterium]